MINIRFISQDDVSTILSKNIDAAFSEIEESFIAYSNGQVLFPDKISQIFDSTSQNRINCMPATLLNKRVSGMKWVSVFPSNSFNNIQNVSGLMLLSEINTGLPLAVIDGTLSTKFRTAAVGCIAARYLAPSSVNTISIIGSGEEAKMHFALLKRMFPSLSECRVCSRSKSSEDRFISLFKQITPDVSYLACNGNTSACVANSDIIITAISEQKPVLKANDITKGGLYLHVGGWEDEYSVVYKANKIVCDDWESCKHRTQTLVRMYNEGLLSDSAIYASLSELITGKKCGRKNDDEFIYFNSVGLSFIDVSLANFIFSEAISSNIGETLTLSSGNETDFKSFI